MNASAMIAAIPTGMNIRLARSALRRRRIRFPLCGCRSHYSLLQRERIPNTVKREAAYVQTRSTQPIHTFRCAFVYDVPGIVSSNGVVMTRATSSFARLLRHYRLAAGLTQEELAERARLSARAISDLERGVKVLPHRNTVALLADALDIPVEDLEHALERRRGPRALRDKALLPIPPTSFVGRDAEIRDITNLLRQPGTRLITVTGAPGIGKTRLTLAAAETMAREFADGAIFVPLAPIWDADLVPEVLAQTLGVQPVDSRSVEQLLIDHLRTKHILLIVDNFEHVLDAGSTLARILT
ncbi:MAG TPA: helix-turn-helix domain-containing protein, partial [Nitrolancea sp.]